MVSHSRGGVQHGEHHDHEAYVGDRTTDAIVTFAEKLVPAPAGSQQALPAADEHHASQTVKVRLLTPHVPASQRRGGGGRLQQVLVLASVMVVF